MRQIRIDYQRPPQLAPRGAGGPGAARAGATFQVSERCPRHPEVVMARAGTNPQWNTMRYFCPRCSEAGMPLLEVATAVVTAWMAERGFGFLENGGPRIFLHVSELPQGVLPYVGMPLTCFVEQNAKGLIARRARPR